MAKETPPKKPENTGRGKVTPLQISVIVDRYLAENNFTNTLATFRSEAWALFSQTIGKKVPKGLLSLSDILDDYMYLKAQKMRVDGEKTRMFSQITQDVAPMLNSTPSYGSLPAQLMHSMPIVTSAPAMIPTKYPEPERFPTPITNPSSKMKRNASKLVTKEPPAPKRSRVQLPADASTDGAVKQTSQVSTNGTGGTQVMVGKFSSYQTMVSSHSKNGPSPVQGSSVAKSFFKQLPESQVNATTPKTPPLAFPSPVDKPGSRTDISDAPLISEQPATAEPLISDEEMQNVMDFDFPDLDIDFSVAELLDDFDLDCIAFPDHMPPYPSA